MIRFWILAIISSVTLQVWAESPQTIPGVIHDLKGSQWEGTFSFPGSENSIQIDFQSDLSATGDVRYFHTLGGSGAVTELLGKVDKACEFTPRSIHLEPGTEVGTQTGTISTYDCAKSAAEEKILNEKVRTKDSPRPAAHNITVSHFSLKPNGQLIIQAKIAGIEVNYTLNRKSLNHAGSVKTGKQPDTTNDNHVVPTEQQTDITR